MAASHQLQVAHANYLKQYMRKVCKDTVPVHIKQLDRQSTTDRLCAEAGFGVGIAFANLCVTVLGVSKKISLCDLQLSSMACCLCHYTFATGRVCTEHLVPHKTLRDKWN